MFTLIKYLYIRKKNIFKYYNVYKRRVYMYTLYEVSNSTVGATLYYRNCNQTKQIVTISSRTLTELRLRFSHFELAVLGLIIFRDKFSKKTVDNQFDKKVINYLSEQPLTKGFLEYLAFCDKNELKQLLCSTSNDN